MSIPAARSPRTRGWLSDFGWSEGCLLIRKTGIRLPLDHRLAAEVMHWVPYLARLGAAFAAARLARRPQLSIRYLPDVPRPWYLMRGAALWAGYTVAGARAEADATFYFEDVTAAAPIDPPSGPAFNLACTDISKGHVARVFEAVFGYPLAVDPARHQGPMVEKSEKNGVHDGRLVTRADGVRAGCVYQRLVDTTDDQGVAHDLRTLCAGGRPVLVWVKDKPAGARFAIHNRKAALRDPADLFDAEELRLIGVFTDRMGLDWGGLDILRDRHDGRIYIVDVNKTDLGPVIALNWRDKVRSMERLAGAMETLIADRLAERGRPSHPDIGEVARAA